MILHRRGAQGLADMASFGRLRHNMVLGTYQRRRIDLYQCFRRARPHSGRCDTNLEQCSVPAALSMGEARPFANLSNR
jgi:hypothetical protein